MKDDCLLELYPFLTLEAQTVFGTLVQRGHSTMERLMLSAQITNQQMRKGTGGLACTGLVNYERGRPLSLSENGKRLATLLWDRGAGRR